MAACNAYIGRPEGLLECARTDVHDGSPNGGSRDQWHRSASGYDWADYAAAAGRVEPKTPGSPDPALIAGDWDGSKTQALAYRSLITNLRLMHTRYSALRAQWSESKDESAAPRAVAYQSMVMDLNRVITDAERLASGLL